MGILIWVLVALALIAVDVLCGGSRIAFALPAYGLVAFAGLLSFMPSRVGAVARSTWWCVGTAVLFFGYLLVRTHLSPEEYLARRNLYLILAALLIYFLTVWPLGLSKYRLGLVAVLLVLGVVNTVFGAVQFFQDPHFSPLPFGPRADYGWRASGFFVSPNHLAGFLELCVILGFAVAWWSRWPVSGKILCAFAALICLGGLLLTGSRGGYLGALCGLAVFALLSVALMMSGMDERRWVVVVAMVCFAGVLAWGVKAAVARSYRLDDRTSSMVDDEGNVRRLLGIRRQLGNSALQQFSLNPAFGTGSGTYLYYGRQFRSRLLQTDPIYAHNDYLQLAAEFGAVGLAGFFVFLLTHLRHGWKYFQAALRRARHEGAVASHSLALCVGSIACVAAYAAHSMLDFNLQIPANTLVVALVFGVLARPGGRAEEATVPGVAPWLPRVALPALGLWLAAVALPKAPAEYWSEKARALIVLDALRDSPELAREAEAHARHGLTTDPGNPRLYYLLGEARMMLAGQSTDPVEQTRILEEASEAYRQGLQLAPRDRYLVLCLAWALDALERYEEAEPFFHEALRLDPKAADVHWAYAAHLQARGRLAEAEKAYREAANLGSRAAAEALRTLPPAGSEAR